AETPTLSKRCNPCTQTLSNDSVPQQAHRRVIFLTNGLLYAAKNCHGKREAALPVHRPRHDVQIASRLGADPKPCGGCHSLPVLAPALPEIVCSSLMRPCSDRRPSQIPTPITGGSERRTRSTGTLSTKCGCSPVMTTSCGHSDTPSFSRQRFFSAIRTLLCHRSWRRTRRFMSSINTT